MIRNHEKPWLISSAGDHQIDKIQSAKYIRHYTSSYPFPGVKASVKKKMAWIDDLNNTYEDIMEDSFFSAPAPNPVDFAKDVLYEHCPQDVRVDIVVDWDRFQSIAGEMKDDEKRMMIRNVPKYLTSRDKDKTKDNDAIEWSTFEDCLTYLSDKCKITTKKPNGESVSMVVIASQTISKDSRAIKEMNEIIQAIGLKPYVSGATGSDIETSNYFWGLDRILGRNMYSQDEAGVVYWRMYLQFHKANMTEVEKATMIYKAELESNIEESEKRGNPKMYVLLKRKDVKKKAHMCDEDEDEDDHDEEDDEEEDIPSTPDYVQPLWLPDSYREHYRRIARHFHNGEGETINIQQRLEKGTTDTGNIKIELFEFELEYVKSQQCPKEKFGAALALTKVAQDDNYWMHDNENHKKLQGLVKDLADLWKNDLLQHDDSTIGLGLEDGTGTALVVKELNNENG